MNRKSTAIISSFAFLAIFLWVFYLNESEDGLDNIKKRRTLSIASTDENLSRKTENIKNVRESESKKLKPKATAQEIKKYKKFCRDHKKEFFSNEEEFMDLLYNDHENYNYIEDQIEFLSMFALIIMDEKPEGEKVCLLDDYYKRLKALLDAYKSKKQDNEQRIKFTKPILQGAIAFSSSSQISALAIVRELIVHKLISSSYLYEWKDYMNKLKEVEVRYAAGKITKDFYKSEQSKLGDDVSFLLLTIDRSLQ